MIGTTNDHLQQISETLTRIADILAKVYETPMRGIRVVSSSERRKEIRDETGS